MILVLSIIRSLQTKKRVSCHSSTFISFQKCPEVAILFSRYSGSSIPDGFKIEFLDCHMQLYVMELIVFFEELEIFFQMKE